MKIILLLHLIAVKKGHKFGHGVGWVESVGAPNRWGRRAQEKVPRKEGGEKEKVFPPLPLRIGSKARQAKSAEMPGG